MQNARRPRTARFLDVAKDNEAYRFTTRWQVAARCEDVSDALEDTDRISRWWPSPSIANARSSNGVENTASADESRSRRKAFCRT